MEAEKSLDMSFASLRTRNASGIFRLKFKGLKIRGKWYNFQPDREDLRLSAGVQRPEDRGLQCLYAEE